MAKNESSGDIGKLMRRSRMKSDMVSTGTIRRGRTVKSLSGTSLDRHALRAPLAHPPGDDQARQGEGGEYGGEDAEPERDRKAAHRAGADEEQHERGDEGGDVGIEDGGVRAGEAGVERAG